MASARSAWGIDVGNRALKAIRLSAEGDNYKVEDFDVVEHEQILSTTGDNRESLLQKALADFAQRHDMRKTPVAIGVSGQSSFARFIKLPPVEAKKIPEIVRFEAIQQIPFPLDDVEWSYQLFEEADSPETEVGIFAMRKELVNRQVGYFTDLGMNVQAVQMTPLAVYNAMYRDGRVQGATMFMDSGAENTDLIIAEGETVWLRTLPIGGNTFTEALAKAFKLNFQKAEELKRNAATSKYARQIFQAMRPVFADLVAEVQRSMGFYASVHRDSRIKRIVALGSTFKLSGLQKYLQQNLQLEVERVDSFRALPPDDGKQAAIFGENAVSLAGAYGLALQAMGDSKINSSLLPAAIRRAKMWKEKTKWFAAAAAIFVVGTGVAYARYIMDNSAFEAHAQDRTKIADTAKKAKSFDAQWSAVESGGFDDRAKILFVQQLKDYRDVWANLNADITGALPQTGVAATPAEMKAKWAERAKREVIFIDSIVSQYRPDLNAALAKDAAAFVSITPGTEADRTGGGTNTEPGMNGGAPTDPAISTAGPTKRGYLVWIKGTCPQPRAGFFISTSFAKKLEKEVSASAALKDQKQYYIARAEVGRIGMRTINMVGPGANSQNVGGPMGFEAAVSGSRAPEGEAMLVDPTQDLMYPGDANEKITSDTEFEVIMAVVLDPPPPTEPAAQASAQ